MLAQTTHLRKSKPNIRTKTFLLWYSWYWYYKSAFFYSTFWLDAQNRTKSSSPHTPPTPSTVDEQCAFYDMNHEERGLAIILNHFKFGSKKYRDLQRNGTELDCERLQKTFRELDFKVKTYNDLTRAEIHMKLQKGNICNIIW